MKINVESNGRMVIPLAYCDAMQQDIRTHAGGRFLSHAFHGCIVSYLRWAVLVALMVGCFDGVMGQDVSKRDLRATYYISEGDGARWIEGTGGAQIELMPGPKHYTYLTLQRFHRLLVEEVNESSPGMNATFKGRWHLDGDTVIIRYTRYRSKIELRFDASDTRYLKATGEGSSYQRLLQTNEAGNRLLRMTWKAQQRRLKHRERRSDRQWKREMKQWHKEQPATP